MHESKQYLTKLIDNSNFECVYNGVQLQSKRDTVSTCGRWVCLWLMKFKEGFNLEQFYEFIDIQVESLGFKGALKYDLVCVNQIPYMPN